MSEPLIEWSVANSDGAKMPRTNWEKLRAFRIAPQPRERQCEIADFLDTETARIGALVEAKRRLIALLSARRQAALGEAIDAAAGIELPLRRVVDSFVDYRGATPPKTASGIPLVTATNISDGEINLTLGEQFISHETYDDWMGRGLPELGDVLLTTEAPLGQVAVIEDTRVALAQRIILMRPNRQRFASGFLFASLRSRRVQADLLSRASGSTVWGIRADRLRDVRVRVPSMSDQESIVARLAKIESEYRQARRLLERQIDLLDEHRQALITAAVTGQLDVAKAAA